jgi:hypothetical protein
MQSLKLNNKPKYVPRIGDVVLFCTGADSWTPAIVENIVDEEGWKLDLVTFQGGIVMGYFEAPFIGDDEYAYYGVWKEKEDNMTIEEWEEIQEAKRKEEEKLKKAEEAAKGIKRKMLL